MNRVGFIVSTVLVVLALLSSTLFVVDQRQFGVVYALGQIKEVITEPGLHAKLPPPFQNVSYIDKRLLTLESTDTGAVLTFPSGAAATRSPESRTDPDATLQTIAQAGVIP